MIGFGRFATNYAQNCRVSTPKERAASRPIGSPCCGPHDGDRPAGRMRSADHSVLAGSGGVTGNLAHSSHKRTRAFSTHPAGAVTHFVTDSGGFGVPPTPYVPLRPGGFDSH